VYKGYKTGAVDYIYKPINTELLRAKVTVFIELYRQNHKLLAQEAKLKAINISLEKEVRERIKSEALLSEAQKITHLGSWEWNTSNNYFIWSDELFRIFGYEPNAVTVNFKSFLNHIHPDDLERVSMTLRVSYAHKQPFTIEHRIIKADGETRYVLGKGRIITDEHSGETRILGILLDITDLKDTQEQLRQKDEFISIASHELRTPLTSIKAYNQLINRCLETNDIENVKKFSKKSEAYIQKLHNLIEDLLNVSKIQAGKMQYCISEFDFDELVNDTIENIRLVSNNYNIKLQGATGTKIKGDKERLEQVIVNYVSNAIKYSPDSKDVIIDIKKDEDDYIHVAVKDFGIGISKEQVQKIFDRYYRVQSSANKFTGLGIGLYISSEIIKKHSGHTWVESEPGKGSTFFFKLPVKTEMAE
jgi:two-component system CheB/CheR fusion protein